MVDTFVADQVLAQINLFPETHNQATWQRETETCGTTRCIAGWAVHFSDKYDIQVEHCDCSINCSYNDPRVVRKSDGHTVSWTEAGADALGLDEDTAYSLFHNMNNIQAVSRLKDILNEQ